MSNFEINIEPWDLNRRLTAFYLLEHHLQLILTFLVSQVGAIGLFGRRATKHVEGLDRGVERDCARIPYQSTGGIVKGMI